MKPILNIINQLHEIEFKLGVNQSLDPVSRHLDRIKNHLNELGYEYHSPLNEIYTTERTDCEASIAGDTTEGSMQITRVIKPAIYQKSAAGDQLLQKAIVIVES